ncbi:MAG: hypothetical protein Q7S09_01605 [bacterium]|nr:hypothetical protein [bacterium]
MLNRKCLADVEKVLECLIGGIEEKDLADLVVGESFRGGMTRFRLHHRCPKDALSESEFCREHNGKNVKLAHRPHRLLVQFTVTDEDAASLSKHVVAGEYRTKKDFQDRNQERRESPLLQQSTTVVDGDGISLSGVLAELKAAGYYIYQTRISTWQTKKGPRKIFEVRFGEPGFYRKPAVLHEAEGLIEQMFVSTGKVRATQNVSYEHVEGGMRCTHSVQVFSTTQEPATAALKFNSGNWVTMPHAAPAA